jgi:hypothetical protein
MANRIATDRQEQANDFVDTARALSRELERAMLAICGNELAELEESIAEQEILTARLKGIQRRLRARDDIHPAPRAALARTGFDKEMADEVEAAHTELQELNRVYEAVLQHSSHSTCLMVSLLDSFKGHFQEAPGPRLKHQTWSCQM